MTFTAAQVGEFLGASSSVVLRCADACRAQLSPLAGAGGARFTAEDVDVIARHLAREEPGFLVMLVCAWCGRELGLRKGYARAGVSHGVCPDCARQLMRDYEQARALAG